MGFYGYRVLRFYGYREGGIKNNKVNESFKM